MYIPPKLRCEERERLFEFIDQHSFAVLTSLVEGQMFASHLPMVVREGKLTAHMARANPQWKSFSRDPQCLCVFSGPHAYISPEWYQGEKNVPTWNYAAVHVAGRAEVIADSSYTDILLHELVEKYESENQTNWSYKIDPGYKQALMGGLVAFEISIDTIEGKFKFNQTSQLDDLKGAISGLKSKGDATSKAVARWMEDCNKDRLG